MTPVTKTKTALQIKPTTKHVVENKGNKKENKTSRTRGQTKGKTKRKNEGNGK